MSHLLTRLRDAILGARRPLPAVRGWAVELEPQLLPEERQHLLGRLDRVLGLVEATLPDHLAAVRPHVTRIRVVRFPCRGAFLPATGELVVERTFLADPGRHDAEIGATIVHEGEHARLRGEGRAEAMCSAEEERACRRIEIAFGERVAGGAVVLERARAALALDDRGVAPDVDWNEAWRRVDAG